MIKRQKKKSFMMSRLREKSVNSDDDENGKPKFDNYTF